MYRLVRLTGDQGDSSSDLMPMTIVREIDDLLTCKRGGEQREVGERNAERKEGPAIDCE